jgi:hypothetical protein
MESRRVESPDLKGVKTFKKPGHYPHSYPLT